jgi:hypothetical protein
MQSNAHFMIFAVQQVLLSGFLEEMCVLLLFSFASLAHYFYCTMMHYVNHNTKSSNIVPCMFCVIDFDNPICFVSFKSGRERERDREEERGRDKETKGAADK